MKTPKLQSILRHLTAFLRIVTLLCALLCLCACAATDGPSVTPSLAATPTATPVPTPSPSSYLAPTLFYEDEYIQIRRNHAPNEYRIHYKKGDEQNTIPEHVFKAVTPPEVRPLGEYYYEIKCIEEDETGAKNQSYIVDSCKWKMYKEPRDVLHAQDGLLIYIQSDEESPYQRMFVCAVEREAKYQESFLLPLTERELSQGAIANVALQDGCIYVTYEKDGVKSTDSFALGQEISPWCTAYYEWAVQVNNTWGDYMFIDLNLDGTPELLHSVSGTAGEFFIGGASFQNGKLIPFEMELSSLHLLEDKKTGKTLWLTDHSAMHHSYSCGCWYLSDYTNIREPLSKRVLEHHADTPFEDAHWMYWYDGNEDSGSSPEEEWYPFAQTLEEQMWQDIALTYNDIGFARSSMVHATDPLFSDFLIAGMEWLHWIW